jgi:hypothetical protein
MSCHVPANQPVYQLLLNKAASYSPEKAYQAKAYNNAALSVLTFDKNIYTVEGRQQIISLPEIGNSIAVDFIKKIVPKIKNTTPAVTKTPADSLDILLQSIGRKKCANKENVGFVRTFSLLAKRCNPDEVELIALYNHAAVVIAVCPINLEHLFSRNPDYKRPIKVFIEPRIDDMIRESANAVFSWSDDDDDDDE